MVPDISQITGIDDFTTKKESDRELYYKSEHVFLVKNHNTIEIRTDEKLGSLLKEKYESVMESRYFGRGGIEIVLANQLDNQEVEDLIRLSYNLTK